MQERIAKASSATKESEMHAKVKQDKVARIKSLRQQIAAVQSETSKLKEAGHLDSSCNCVDLPPVRSGWSVKDTRCFSKR